LPRKFKLTWKGLYVVKKVLGNNIVMLGNLDDDDFHKVNAHNLKHHVTRPFIRNPLPNYNLVGLGEKHLGL